jgi:DNA/RNA-binding domain of Phe-tRNA-synthetase-like protein
MTRFTYSISSEIFNLFPNYVRGVIVAVNIENLQSNPAVLESLRAAESAWLTSSLEGFLESPKIANWRTAFRRFGASPSEFRPAHEALIRRAIAGKNLPDINTAVNIGNTLSLRHQVPVGVHPLDSLKFGLELRRARGDEVFIPFGAEAVQRPTLGEIVLVEGNEILSRFWVWRQAKSSVTLSTTKSIVINIDGLEPLGESDVMAVCEQAEKEIQKWCGGVTSYFILSSRNPLISFDIP